MTPRHLGLCLALCASDCSTSRPEEPAPAFDELVLAARRGFVRDGALLKNQQPQWRATVAASGELVFSAQPFAGYPASRGSATPW